MFELSVACKYLLPRWRQLSVSIISLISILVISLVVWLVVVFFSVTDGLEKSWIHKLTALTAPVRITPTEAYYHSYYYQIDSISEASEYSHKSIAEKKEALAVDPYDSNVDEEIPSYWPTPDRDANGEVKDLVKLAYTSIDELKGIKGLRAQDFELTASQIRLRLLRHLDAPHSAHSYQGSSQSYLSYPAYLGTFDSDNPQLSQTLLPIDTQDLNNLFTLTGIAENFEQEETEKNSLFPFDVFQRRLHSFLEHVDITSLKTHSWGWAIPSSLLPTQVNWTVYAVFKGEKLLKVIVPSTHQEMPSLQARLSEDPEFTIRVGQLKIQDQSRSLEFPQEVIPLPTNISITLVGGTIFPAQLVAETVDNTRRIEDIKFHVQIPIQETTLQGNILYRGLEIGSTTIKQSPAASSLWVHANGTNQPEEASLILPNDPDIGEGVLLPKSFKEAGVLVGDRGFLTYVAPTTSILQEQRLPIYVAGFYDPGIIPIGGKFLLVNRDTLAIIRASHNSEDKTTMTNGINVRFADFKQADDVKAQLLQAFKEKGISRYWNVETYREYEFTKEIMQELQSQKSIFLVISIVIILVACSNIISMLIILVNDKKVEIGILRSMGASSKSIAFIFGVAGAIIGLIGSMVGIGAAIVTLKNLQSLVNMISRIQGYDIFNTAFYGEVVPQELSYDALSFVFIATVIMSLLAGIVPAVKACLLRPSTILRSTG